MNVISSFNASAEEDFRNTERDDKGVACASKVVFLILVPFSHVVDSILFFYANVSLIEITFRVRRLTF